MEDRFNGVEAVSGAEDFAVIRSVFSTAKKQHWDVLNAINAQPHSVIAQLQLA